MILALSVLSVLIVFVDSLMIVIVTVKLHTYLNSESLTLKMKVNDIHDYTKSRRPCVFYLLANACKIDA